MMFGNGENRRGEYETRRRARGAPPGLREIATPAKIEDIYMRKKMRRSWNWANMGSKKGICNERYLDTATKEVRGVWNLGRKFPDRRATRRARDSMSGRIPIYVISVNRAFFVLFKAIV